MVEKGLGPPSWIHCVVYLWLTKITKRCALKPRELISLFLASLSQEYGFQEDGISHLKHCFVSTEGHKALECVGHSATQGTRLISHRQPRGRLSPRQQENPTQEHNKHRANYIIHLIPTVEHPLYVSSMVEVSSIFSENENASRYHWLSH